MQAVFEDYIHKEGRKLLAIYSVKAICLLLGGACVFSILKIAFRASLIAACMSTHMNDAALSSNNGFALMPSHPGRTLRRELEARGLTASAFALRIRVPANRLTEIIKGRRGITADTAIRLDEALGISARFWMDAASRIRSIDCRARQPRPYP